MLFIDWSAWLCFIAAMLALVAFLIASVKVGKREREWKIGYRIFAGFLGAAVGLVIICACLLAGFDLPPDIHGDPIYSQNHSRAARPTDWGYVFAGGTAVDLFSWKGLLRQRVFGQSDGEYGFLQVIWINDHSLVVGYPKEFGAPFCASTRTVHVECRAMNDESSTAPQTRTGSSSSTGELKALR